MDDQAGARIDIANSGNVGQVVGNLLVAQRHPRNRDRSIRGKGRPVGRKIPADPQVDLGQEGNIIFVRRYRIPFARDRILTHFQIVSPADSEILVDVVPVQADFGTSVDRPAVGEVVID